MEDYPLAYDDIAACQLLGGKDVRKSGMIRKKSGGIKMPVLQSKYDHRFAIIKKGWVYYYEKKTSKKPQKKFSLQGFSNRVINAEEEQTIMPFAFKIYPMAAKQRTWYFACENQQEMDEWMESFRLEIEQYNNKGPRINRISKSCPNKTAQTLNPNVSAFNRPQSINNPAINDKSGPFSPSNYFPSQSDVTSGIGSSTSSLEPQDDYEPVEDTVTDEFSCTDSEDEYENPSAFYEEPAPDIPTGMQWHSSSASISGEKQGHRPYWKPPLHNLNPVPRYLPKREYSKQPDDKYGFAKYPPPTPKRPISYAPPSNPPYHERKPHLPNRPFSMLPAGAGEAFRLNPINRKPITSPPSCPPPLLPGKSHEEKSQYPGVIKNTSNYPKHDLQLQRSQSDLLSTIDSSPNRNQRHRSEATINEENQLTFAQKHQSMPVVSSLRNELDVALKIGARKNNAPPLPSKDYRKDSLQQTWNTSVTANEQVSSPTNFYPAQYHPSPMYSPKPLPSVPEIPSRPPPLPPTAECSRFPFSQPKSPIVPSNQFSPLPSKIPDSQYPGPALPPKPSNTGSNFARHQTGNINDTPSDNYYPDNYNDTLLGGNIGLEQEDPGIYDNMQGEDPEIIYENDEDCVDRNTPTQKQSCNENGMGRTWQTSKAPPHNPRPKWPETETQQEDSRPEWMNRLKSTEARHGDAKPKWLDTKLKSTASPNMPKPVSQPKDYPPVQNRDTGTVSPVEKMASGFDQQTPNRPPWQNNRSPTAAPNQPKPLSQPKDYPPVQKRDTGTVSPVENRASGFDQQTSNRPPWQNNRPPTAASNQPKPLSQPKDYPPVQKRDTGTVSPVEKMASGFDQQTSNRPPWQNNRPPTAAPNQPKPLSQPKDYPPVQNRDTGTVSPVEKIASGFDQQTPNRPHWQNNRPLTAAPNQPKPLSQPKDHHPVQKRNYGTVLPVEKMASGLDQPTPNRAAWQNSRPPIAQAKPLVPSKPKTAFENQKPNITKKPATFQKPDFDKGKPNLLMQSAADRKSSSPAIPEPSTPSDGKPTSSVAAMRSRFQ